MLLHGVKVHVGRTDDDHAVTLWIPDPHNHRGWIWVAITPEESRGLARLLDKHAKACVGDAIEGEVVTV